MRRRAQVQRWSQTAALGFQFGTPQSSWTEPHSHWTPPLVTFQKGKADYIANALEQPLLLPQDMANLRTLKKHEVFLTLKRDLAIVCALTNFLYYIFDLLYIYIYNIFFYILENLTY